MTGVQTCALPIFDSFKALFEISYKFRFVSLGFAYLVREFDEIKVTTLQNFENRKELLQKVAAFLDTNGYLRAEEVLGENASKIHNLLLLCNFWIADAQLFYKGTEEDKVDYYLMMFYNAARPSLTESGIKLFQSPIMENRIMA